MARHVFLIIDKESGDIIERDSTTAAYEWIGCLWANMIHLYDTGKYKTQKLVHLAPKPEDCKTITDEEIIRFCMLFGAPAPGE